jgi:hypothetical protein
LLQRLSHIEHELPMGFVGGSSSRVDAPLRVEPILISRSH